MGNVSQMCETAPLPIEEHINQSQSKLKADILESREEVKDLPALPPQAREKIVSQMKISKIDQIWALSKIWKVKHPIKFYYINDPLHQDFVPMGRTSIFIYSDKKEFCAFFNGNINEEGVRDNKDSIYVFANGDYYIGDSEKFNFGVYCDCYGEYKYEGDWVNGKAHGIGKEITKKSTYEGYFYNGKKEGSGKCVFIDQTEYEGDFKNNLIEGQGKLVDQKSNYEYVGGFKANQKDGKGIEKSSEYTYDGHFVKGKKEGKGSLIFTNENREYFGEFENNQPNGEGTTREKGREIHGIWMNGKLISVIDSKPI